MSPNRIPRATLLIAGLLHLFASAAAAQLPDGWNVSWVQSRHSVTTHTASAAFVLEEGESPHPEIGADGLQAAFGAQVRIRTAGRYRFGVELEGGAAQLSVTDEFRAPLGGVSVSAGETAFTPWIDLRQGAVELVLSFQREGAQRARLRTLWELEFKRNGGFPVEPIPSRATRPWSGFEARLSEEQAALRGRALLERKGCTSCHAASAAQHQAVGLRRGPELARAGERASIDWLARWIAEPAALRPGSDMPGLFGASEAEREEALDIARWLATTSGPRALDEPIDPHQFTVGRALYHRVGCVACHGALASQAVLHDDPFLDEFLPPTPPRTPFGALDGKWTRASLAEMLRDPTAIHPDGRMPSLALSEDEARAIAGYLIASWSADVEERPELQILAEALQRGREAFGARACGACHELNDAPAAPMVAPPLEALDAARGCLDPSDERTPRYQLQEEERAALALGLRSVRAASGDPAPHDRARRDMLLLDCGACHIIDGQGGPSAELRPFFITDEEVDLGDEGRIPPDLSGVGFKLQTAWLEELLAGAPPARPYMSARMPHYGKAVDGLGAALARQEGVAPHTDLDPPATSDELVLSGRALMGREAMACVACHIFGDRPPDGTPGTDLTAFAERLRYEWYRAFLLDPVRYKPGTRMPAFGTGGVSTIRSVHGGDMLRQTDAMWAYLGLGEFMPAPPGLEAAAAMQLEVGERPRVLRSFLENAGSRGIAVGFPIGVHYTFDAHAARLREVWRGSFLDASGAWSGRGGEPSGGRGPVIWTAPPGPPLVFGPRPDVWPETDPEDLGTKSSYQFHGYRLDAQGVPELLYSIDGVRVAERIVPRLDALVRRFRLSGLPQTSQAWLRAGLADSVVEHFATGTTREAWSTPAADGVKVCELVPVRGAVTVEWTIPFAREPR